MNISFYSLVHHERDKILNGIQCLTALSDQNSHIIAFKIDIQDVGFPVKIIRDFNIHSHCTEHRL